MYKVYLDCDGVLSDFVGKVAELKGLPHDLERWPYTPGIDAFEVMGIDRAEVMDLMGAQQVRSMSEMPDARLIYLAVLVFCKRHCGGELPTLVTKCFPTPGSYSGKFRWIEEHFPELAYKPKLIGWHGCKSDLAAPGRILIDDEFGNVVAWKAGGGEAILVPRPWGVLHEQAGEATQEVAAQLSNIVRNSA